MDNAHFRYGSARDATSHDYARAGLFTQTPDSVLLGFDGNRPLYFGGQGGIATVAGARSGKLRDVLAYTLCGAGFTGGHIVCLDPKGGELAAISQDQTRLKKYCIYWNPLGTGRFPKHRINPVDYIRSDAPDLVARTKTFCENAIARTGSANGEYFEVRAREFVEAFALVLADLDGVLTLPRLYQMISLSVEGGDEWLDFAYEMHISRHLVARRIEAEIAQNQSENATGFRGIMGEVFKAFQALSDPLLMESVSPPFDFSFEDLLQGRQLYNVYMMPPVEYLDTWALVIKAMFTAAMVYKSDKPEAARQLWIMDELGQIGAFPLALKMYTYGAGINIRPWGVWQSVNQMDRLGPNARNILLSSAAVQQYFGVRDIETAAAISRMCGTQTLEYEDELSQHRAAHGKQAAVATFMQGGDPMQAMLSVRQQAFEAQYKHKKSRDLRTADEVLNAPSDRQFIFCDEIDAVLNCERKPYYEQGFMAGLYHPNPYHPPADKVRVKTAFGNQWRWVVKSRVTKEFSHYPQYADGVMSKIEGGR